MHHVSTKSFLRFCHSYTITHSTAATPKAVTRSMLQSSPKINNNNNKDNKYQYVSLLQICSNVEQLRQLHARLLTCGLAQNRFLATSLLSAYAFFGTLHNARLMFVKFREQSDDIWLWNSMIRVYSREGFFLEALDLFHQMRYKTLNPNNSTFPSVLRACAGLSDLQEGMRIHKKIIQAGFELDIYVGAALVDMYAKCGRMEDARQVFDKMPLRDVVSWTAMIAGYAQNGYNYEALALLNEMLAVGIMPNCVTIASALSSCGDLGALQQGRWLHHYLIRMRFEFNVFVGTALLDMYAKCGFIKFALQVFVEMPERNVVSWSAMIEGFVCNGCENEALQLFSWMQFQGFRPNCVTLVGVLVACGNLGALQQGKGIHGCVIRTGLDLDVSVGTGLIDMYSKCGSVKMARRVFDGMCDRDFVSWSAMIAVYGLHGYAEEALSLFVQMQQANEKPNEVTFISVLNACSHAGKVDEGRHYFEAMTKDYLIKPSLKHYACMVDLLGRAGHLEEAQDFIDRIPIEPDSGVWGALLGACRIHDNIELGVHVAKCLLALEPEDAGYYVLVSNMYAAAGRWEDVVKIRIMMRARGVIKPPGYSFIELNSKIHVFMVGDRWHHHS